MDKIVRKRNDTTPLTGTLTRNGTAADLSNASEVEFFMKSGVDDPLKASGVATIVDAASGTVRYEFSADDADESGHFLAEWQVTYADGTVQTFPNDTFMGIKITDDLSE